MIVQLCRDILRENSSGGVPREIHLGVKYHPHIEAFVKKVAPKKPTLLVTVNSVPFYVDPKMQKGKKAKGFRIVK